MTKATAWNAACYSLLVAVGIFTAVVLFTAWSA
jgi:hypothetical protein